MLLGEHLDVTELRKLIASRHILRRNHPTLPIAILNYSNECTFSNFWPDTVQKCRGLIINPKENHEVCDDCQIVSRPFHKFFNLNDSNHPESVESNLPLVDPTVTEKMDGWFGIQWQCGNEYGVASRGSFDSIGAKLATQRLQKLVKYGAIEEFPKGYTPIYEIISKDCKVVVDYPFEGLVLLGLVNNETGEELPYDELFKVWAKILTYSADNRPWIRLVKAHTMTVDDCIASPKKNFEGFVLSYPRPGTYPIKVKVKLDDYKRLHKIITGVTPQMIWKTLHDPMEPWIGNQAPDHFKKWAMVWRDELYSAFQKKLSTVLKLGHVVHMEMIALGLENDRKLVVEAFKEADPDLGEIALCLLDGKIYEAHQAIWKRIRPVGRQSETFYREGQGE